MPKIFVDISQTFSTQNNTHFLTNTSLLTKMYENGSMNGLPQKSDSFLAWHPPIARQVGKMYS